MSLISLIEGLFNNLPSIDNDQEKLVAHIRAIHELDRAEKGIAFGQALYAAGVLQGVQSDMSTFEKLNELSAEANNRIYAHVLYLAELHNLNFISAEVHQNLTSIMIDFAVGLVSSIPQGHDIDLGDLGIKGVEFVSKNILD